jgi:hypothetical protein
MAATRGEPVSPTLSRPVASGRAGGRGAGRLSSTIVHTFGSRFGLEKIGVATGTASYGASGIAAEARVSTWSPGSGVWLGRPPAGNEAPSAGPHSKWGTFEVC